MTKLAVSAISLALLCCLAPSARADNGWHNRVVARQTAHQLGMGATETGCLTWIISHEAPSWSTSETNQQSGAYGLPQALPGYKMASAGPDWRWNPVTQVRWMVGYVRGRYGSACGAKQAWLARSPHWY